MKFTMMVLMSFMFLSHPAGATCLQTCEDADAGDDTAHFGVTSVVTSCAAPGGQIHTSIRNFFDECQDGVATEYSCGPATFLGVEEAVKKTYSCDLCDPKLRGVCLSVVRFLSESTPGDATQSCSSVTEVK